MDNQNYNELTPEEEKVIISKGTEKPFSGEYDKFFRAGQYICRRCGQPLYESKDKFDSGCGWPSFDREIKGAVKKQPDPDGSRTEITCTNCGAHLGHVFTGEKLTAKNTRFCVNSISMRFVPQKFLEDEQSFAVLGGGCFWCLEAVFSRLKGINKVVSGYAGGRTLDPDYDKVSAGKTGHAEVVKIVYDPKVISFNDLVEVFFYLHDPTTLNRQGNDVGKQYRSIILYATLEQKEQAEKFIKKLSEEKIFKDPIITEVKPLIRFYKAEESQQEYFERNKDKNPYCHVVIDPKLAKLRDKFKQLLKTEKNP